MDGALLPKTADGPTRRSPLPSLVFLVAALSAGFLAWTGVQQRRSSVSLHAGLAETETTVVGHHAERNYTRGPFEVDITFTDFLQFTKVKEFVLSKGVSLDGLTGEGSAELFQYVPRLMKIRGDPELIMGGGKRGALGSVAMHGYTFWSMQYSNSSSLFSAAYTIVIDMTGNIVSISPTMAHLPDNYHFIALKVYDADPRFMIGAVDIEKTQVGPSYLWNWAGNDAKEYIELMDGKSDIGCHDIQVAYDRQAVWVTEGGQGFARYNMATGAKEAEYEFGQVWDANHVQIIEKDTVAIISSRDSNAIVKVDMMESEIKWIAGGVNGTLDLIDMHGHKHPPTTSIWHGQHNVEFIGEEQYALFDDGSCVNHKGTIVGYELNSSRMMIVQVKEDRNSAEIVWTYDVGVVTPYYGDCDRMPSGNMLGAHWVDSAVTPDFKYEARIIEVVKDTKETAWEALIYGDDNLKKNGSSYGWSIYSADRFYLHPLIYDVSCQSGMLTFSLISSFKLHSVAEGHYIVTRSGEKVYYDDISYEPFWRPTHVSVDIDQCKGTLTAYNHHGQHYSVDVSDYVGSNQKVKTWKM